MKTPPTKCYKTLFNPLAGTNLTSEGNDLLEELLTSPYIQINPEADLDSLIHAFHFPSIFDASQSDYITRGLKKFKSNRNQLTTQSFSAAALDGTPQELHSIGGERSVDKIKNIMEALSDPANSNCSVDTTYYNPNQIEEWINIGWLEIHTGTFTFTDKEVFTQMAHALNLSN